LGLSLAANLDLRRLARQNAGRAKKMYAMLGKRYRDVELYDTKRPFMPMMAETSPLSRRNILISPTPSTTCMLHDMVNDILASDWMTESQKQQQIKRAIYMMSADATKT
jgi:hypothetical protein